MSRATIEIDWAGETDGGSYEYDGGFTLDYLSRKGRYRFIIRGDGNNSPPSWEDTGCYEAVASIDVFYLDDGVKVEPVEALYRFTDCLREAADGLCLDEWMDYLPEHGLARCEHCGVVAALEFFTDSIVYPECESCHEPSGVKG